MSEESGIQRSFWSTIPGIITAVATLITAVGGLIVIIRDTGNSAPTPGIAPTAETAVEDVTVRIEGPDEVIFGQRTNFTFISENGVRAEWIAGGFTANQMVPVDNLADIHEIYVEPTNASRIGETFTIIVTVFGSEGQSVRAEKQFTVISDE